jgi:peptide/nickel transport system substrate-binding protein
VPVQSPAAAAAQQPQAAPPAQQPGTAASVEQPQRGGTLSIAVSGDPISFDVHQEPSILSLEPMVPIYNGLVTYDLVITDKIVGDLAERFEVSADGLVYTFFLRSNVKWHDGVPFTAEDARYSFERMRQPPAGVRSIRSPELTFVKSIQAADDRTLKITLTQRYGSFLQQLATDWFLVMPKHILEAKQHMKTEAVGTGPFKLKSYTKGVSVELVRNPDYFKPGLPYLDGIIYLIIKDPATRVAALRTGQAHMSGHIFANLAPSEAAALRREAPGMEIVRAPGLSSAWFHLNLRRKPLADVRVRRAISISFDRQTAIKVLAENEAELGSFVPPGAWGMAQSDLLKTPGFREPKSLDLADAKKLLAEAGYPDGFAVKMTCRDIVARSCEYWQAQLKLINIAATIDVKESGPTAEIQSSGAFDVLVSQNVFRLNDPDDIGRKWVTGAPQNYTGYSNPTVDELMAQQQAENDPAKRVALVRRIETILLDEAPTLQPYWDVALMAVSSKLRGVPTPQGQYNNMRHETIWFSS